MSTVATWPSQAESWLDERGKGAWIAATVVGFIFFWPVGLALLAYMIWGKNMFNAPSARNCSKRRMAKRYGYSTSGNAAFDSYKADTLSRLEEEQEAFETFLQRLREAKDKSEFDAFMQDRAGQSASDEEPSAGDAKS